MSCMSAIRFCLATSIGGLLCGICRADDAAVEPLYVTNLSPVAGLLGLPSQRAAAVAVGGQWQLALHGALASHYVNDGHRAEFVHFDGETDRLLLEGRYAFATGWEVQLEVPWLRQDSGFMDATIDHWHDFWGLPDNGRDQVHNNQLDYLYRDANAVPVQRLQSDGSASGIGDVRLSLQHVLYQDDRAALAISAGYKFGSGDRRDFTGSGKGGAYTALRTSLVIADQLDWYGQLGYLRAGQIEGVAYRQQRDLWFAGTGLAWQFAGHWSLLAQIDAHRAPLDSAVDALGETAVMLTGGLRWQPAGNWSVDFSLVEDIAVETAPDVTFQTSIRYRAGR